MFLKQSHLPFYAQSEIWALLENSLIKVYLALVALRLTSPF